MKKSLLIAFAIGASVGIASVGHAAQAGSSTKNEQIYPIDVAATDLAKTSISSKGGTQETDSVKQATINLVNADLQLSVVSRSELDNSSFVSGNSYLEQRRKDVRGIWSSSASVEAFESLQAGIEWGSANESFQPMDAYRFEPDSWHGVQVNEGTATAVLSGNRVETVDGVERTMPKEYLEVQLVKSDEGKWLLNDMKMREVGSF